MLFPSFPTVAAIIQRFRISKPISKPTASGFFGAPSLLNPGALNLDEACSRWVEAILARELDPLAPCVDRIGRLTSPLQAWGQMWVGSLRTQSAHPPWDGRSLIEALPALAQAGLKPDHMQPDRSQQVADSLRGRKGSWTSIEPKFGHMSSSQRPLLHLLIGYDSCRGAGLLAVQAALLSGASPSCRNAFGIPALALCALHPDQELGWDLWRALVDAGADPCEAFISDGSMMGGHASVISHSVSSGAPITPRELALSSASTLGSLLRQHEACEEADALSAACSSSAKASKTRARL